MKTLHLTLTRNWFDAILCGEKNEEYRELKPYWIKRLIEINSPEEMPGENKVIPENIIFDMQSRLPEEFDSVLKGYYSKPKQYDVIEFSNGYGPNVPKMIVEYKGLSFGVGLYVFGAPNYPVFILQLGKILKVKNYELKKLA